jgi:predicted SPOUT superfamily RNA methylase MTH1
MLKVSRRQRSLTVALPGSLTRDIPHLREKTARIGLIGRSLAIFKVSRAIIYRDEPSQKGIVEAALLEKILRFQETPQYLRRHLFKLEPDLQFTGTLPPLRIPSHPNRADPSPGQIREAVVISSGSASKADAGYGQPVTIRASLAMKRRITVRINRTKPTLEGELVEANGLRIYWGFRVNREDVSLAELVKKKDQDLTISTSRKGKDIRDAMEEFKPRWKSSQHPLLLFGSPDKGVPELLTESGTRVEDAADFNLNMIPEQGVETVRTEEALMASLAVLNILDKEDA